jgi:hypothetical protein
LWRRGPDPGGRIDASSLDGVVKAEPLTLRGVSAIRDRVAAAALRFASESGPVSNASQWVHTV